MEYLKFNISGWTPEPGKIWTPYLLGEWRKGSAAFQLLDSNPSLTSTGSWKVPPVGGPSFSSLIWQMGKTVPMCSEIDSSHDAWKRRLLNRRQPFGTPSGSDWCASSWPNRSNSSFISSYFLIDALFYKSALHWGYLYLTPNHTIGHSLKLPTRSCEASLACLLITRPLAWHTATGKAQAREEW